MKVYWCKYALTTGVMVVEVEDDSSGNCRRILSFNDHIWLTTYLHESQLGKEWTPNKEEAQSIVERMISKKLASLRKNIAKLEKLEVKIPDL